MTLTDRWHLRGSADHAYSGEEARHLLRHRWDWGNQETWFENGAGRILVVVTNGERARVMLMDGEGDLGQHLVDPRGEGSSSAYRLSNGQIDSYADRETVPFDVAGHAVAHLIEHGIWPSAVTVVSDRS
ncbi:hypothetical protein SAVIM338S_00316 [Streptomyces avidinii]